MEEERLKDGLTLFYTMADVLKNDKNYQEWIAKTTNINSLTYEELEWIVFMMTTFFGANTNKLLYKLLRVYFLYLDNKDGEDYKNAIIDWIQYYDTIIYKIIVPFVENAKIKKPNIIETTQLMRSIEKTVEFDFEKDVDRKTVFNQRKIVYQIIQTYIDHCKENNKSILYFLIYSVLSYNRDPSIFRNVLNGILSENYDDINVINDAKKKIEYCLREIKAYDLEFIKNSLLFYSSKKEFPNLIQCYIHFTKPIREKELEEQREKEESIYLAEEEERRRLADEEKRLRLEAEAAAEQERLRQAEQERLPSAAASASNFDKYNRMREVGVGQNDILRSMVHDKVDKNKIEEWKASNPAPLNGWMMDGKFDKHLSKSRRKQKKSKKTNDGKKKSRQKSLKKKRKSPKKH